ncbi:MAG: 30S ribosome-binding factor RbfA [Alphaproteobacteria bacterium]
MGTKRRHGKTPSQRQLRLGEELRHALARIVERTDFRDADLKDVPITVTEVRLSPDLKNATAFVMPLGGANIDSVVAALRRAAAFFRGRIAREVKVKFVPLLSFEPDMSFEIASRIDALLQSPPVARDLQEKAGAHDREDAGATGPAKRPEGGRHGA